MSLQVLNILTSSKELLDLIKMVDSVFHSKQAGLGKSKLNSLCRYVPSIREHLQVIFVSFPLFELCLFGFSFQVHNEQMDTVYGFKFLIVPLLGIMTGCIKYLYILKNFSRVVISMMSNVSQNIYLSRGFSMVPYQALCAVILHGQMFLTLQRKLS